MFNMGGLGMRVTQPHNPTISCEPIEEIIKSQGQAASPRLANINPPANHVGSSSRSSFLYFIDLDREYLLSTCKFPCCTKNLINHSRKNKPGGSAESERKKLTKTGLRLWRIRDSWNVQRPLQPPSAASEDKNQKGTPQTPDTPPPLFRPISACPFCSQLK